MERLTLTITRYKKPEETTEDMPMARVSGRGYQGYREENNMFVPPPAPIENVLVVDINEDQYAAIKKAVIDTF